MCHHDPENGARPRVERLGRTVVSDLAGGVDARIGGVTERANRNHHLRRLARIDWDQVVCGEGPGGASRRPPLEGNDLPVYVDGAAALPAIAAAVRGARSFVHIAGWTIAPDFAVARAPRIVTLRDLLADAATRVETRVLVWAGAPVPVMHPSRAEARDLM